MVNTRQQRNRSNRSRKRRGGVTSGSVAAENRSKGLGRGGKRRKSRKGTKKGMRRKTARRAYMKRKGSKKRKLSKRIRRHRHRSSKRGGGLASWMPSFGASAAQKAAQKADATTKVNNVLKLKLHDPDKMTQDQFDTAQAQAFAALPGPGSGEMAQVNADRALLSNWQEASRLKSEAHNLSVKGKMI